MLILARHGQSEGNAAGLLLGRLDSPLTELGKLQAARIGGSLKAAGLAGSVRVLSSPLSRALGTAEIICTALGVEAGPLIEERLIEVDYGVLDGVRHADISADIWKTWRGDVDWHPHGGESLSNLQLRVEDLLEELRTEASTQDVVAVSHVSPIKAATAWAIGAGPDLAWRLSLGVASLTRVSTGARPALVTFGETSHLHGL
ncbi:MAG TPA: histidine phosphatase family protein [Acidimicrobiales bacterium]|jgi:probable phosphoglycerate mutase|nr:histidine phosphatase family protein [Acidimicrobiales bacterium]